jgi:hypothetical protein
MAEGRLEVLLEKARAETDSEGRKVSAAKPSHLLISGAPRKSKNASLPERRIGG